MSTLLPKYLVSTWGDHAAACFPDLTDPDAVAAAAVLRHSIGEYHLWTPSESPAAADLCFVVMRQARFRDPHPAWQHLPHVYKRTTIAEHHQKKLTGWAAAAFTAAKTQDGGYAFGPLVIAPDHDVVDLAFALHALHPVFEP